MSEALHPLPLANQIKVILTEFQRYGTICGVHKLRKTSGTGWQLFGEHLQTPYGVAAGPHTQLAQNIIAAYAAGARYFELKTVQILDGEELSRHIPRPCITARDEGYNVEWSTELTIEQAMEEYIKAWCALKILSKKLGLGDPDGFAFNMSVGYDLAGIRDPRIDRFIEGLKDASTTPYFHQCLRDLEQLLPEDAEFIRSISPRVCRSVTLSTVRGCPAEQTEAIAAYLLKEKGLHTFVKCNPTLLGYTFVHDTLNSLGYGYIALDQHSFEVDMKMEQAVPMFGRLKALAAELGLTFGLKLSNALPVQIRNGELPGDEMYMSGRALYPLTIELAALLATATGGQLPISYCGGADTRSIAALVSAGVWPVTVCTMLLKPGGYNNLASLYDVLIATKPAPFTKIQAGALRGMSSAARAGSTYRKRKERVRTAKGKCILSGKACGICADICPNRANIVQRLAEGRKELVHIDDLCNRCGICADFCPKGTRPYEDSFTVFRCEEQMLASNNSGFAFLRNGSVLLRTDRGMQRCTLNPEDEMDPEIAAMIETVGQDLWIFVE